MGPTVRDLTAPGHTGVTTPAPGAQPDTGPAPRFPRAGMPAKADLDYVKVAIEVALLVLAVPYLLHRLARRPKSTMRRATDSHLSS
jgi:hypothetical protein